MKKMQKKIMLAVLVAVIVLLIMTIIAVAFPVSPKEASQATASSSGHDDYYHPAGSACVVYCDAFDKPQQVSPIYLLLGIEVGAIALIGCIMLLSVKKKPGVPS